MIDIFFEGNLLILIFDNICDKWDFYILDCDTNIVNNQIECLLYISIGVFSLYQNGLI